MKDYTSQQNLEIISKKSALKPPGVYVEKIDKKELSKKGTLVYMRHIHDFNQQNQILRNLKIKNIL